MSRAHSGMSEGYKRKKMIRERREDDLKVLRLAQDVYRKRFNQKFLKGTDMNRTKLSKIRQEIKKYMNDHPGEEFPY